MLNNFIYAKQKALFEEALNNGEVLDEAIVFIEDTKQIWNHGTYFDCSDKHITEENLNEVLSEYITETELNQKGYLTEHQDISGKQDKLVSGINIKTVNGNDILGDGNVVIESGYVDANIQAINFGEAVDDVEIDFALKDEIPTNVSQLNNDSNYITRQKVQEVIEEVASDMITAEPAEGDSEEVEDYVLMKSDIEHIIPYVVEQTDSIVTIQPNVLNVWGEVASLDITIAEPIDNTIVNEYMVQFVSGATATTLTLPNTIKWMSAPSIQANKTYQLSVINNLAIIGEFGDE